MENFFFIAYVFFNINFPSLTSGVNLEYFYYVVKLSSFATKYEIRGRNFSVLRYELVLKIDPYKRKAWNSAKEIER
jgi:hypothetical protein